MSRVSRSTAIPPDPVPAGASTGRSSAFCCARATPANRRPWPEPGSSTSARISMPMLRTEPFLEDANVINLIFTVSRTTLLVAAVALLAAGAANAQNLAEGDINTGYFGSVAIKGYDPVAYFTTGKATVGDPAISTK